MTNLNVKTPDKVSSRGGRQDLTHPCERSPQGGLGTSCFPKNRRSMKKNRMKRWGQKGKRRQSKEKQNCLLLCCKLTLLFYVNPQGNQQAKKVI